MGKVKTPKARQLNYAYWVNTEGIRGKRKKWGAVRVGSVGLTSESMCYVNLLCMWDVC